jgi:hypothetical protein
MENCIKTSKRKTGKAIGSLVLSNGFEPPPSASLTLRGTNHLAVRRGELWREALKKASSLEVVKSVVEASQVAALPTVDRGRSQGHRMMSSSMQQTIVTQGSRANIAATPPPLASPADQHPDCHGHTLRAPIISIPGSAQYEEGPRRQPEEIVD